MADRAVVGERVTSFPLKRCRIARAAAADPGAAQRWTHWQEYELTTKAAIDGPHARQAGIE